MTETRFALLIVLAFGALTVLADVFIKKAADQNQLFSFNFVFGAVLYGLSAFGWFYAFRALNMATVGGAYALSTVILIALVGIIFFREQLQVVEYAVLAVAVISILALWRML